MLTSAEKPRATASRIKGRPALVRRLRGLLIAVHRFGRGRARSREDVAWTAVVLDGLVDVLAVADPSPEAPGRQGHPPPVGTPAPLAASGTRGSRS